MDSKTDCCRGAGSRGSRRTVGPNWLVSFLLLSLSLVAPVAAQDAHRLPIEQAAVERELAAAQPRGALLRSSDLLYAGMFFGSLAALEPLSGIDNGLNPNAAPTGWRKSWYSAGWFAGRPHTMFGFSGATMLGGALLGDSRLTRTGLRSIEALLATDLVVLSAKRVAGRPRPIAGLGPTALDPLSGRENHNSFPSGHTAQMFAIAETFSREYGEDAPWVPWVAYPLAGLTGASRMVGQKHWFTDVVAGAAVGIFSAKLVGRLHGEDGGFGLPFKPTLITTGDAVGVGFQLRF